MIAMRQVSEEVLVTEAELTTVGREEIELLKQSARRNARKRIRLCAHPDVSARVHEMVIVHSNEAYVRPHKHLNKSESFHIIEGQVDVIVFTEEGVVKEITRIGDPSSGEKFYCRISDSRYHTLLIESDVVVFHETTSGPFNKADTVLAPWAPAEDDLPAVKQFMDGLREVIGGKVA